MSLTITKNELMCTLTPLFGEIKHDTRHIKIPRKALSNALQRSLAFFLSWVVETLINGLGPKRLSRTVVCSHIMANPLWVGSRLQNLSADASKKNGPRTVSEVG